MDSATEHYSIKRQRLEYNEATLKWIPSALLGEVCSFLVVRDVRDFLTQVVCQPDIKVPWPCLDKRSTVGYSLLGLEPVYTTARRFSILPHLQVFEAVLCGSSIAPAQAILNGATSLRCLRLSLYERASVLAALARCAPTVTDLRINLAMKGYDTMPDDLEACLRAFSRLDSLALHFRESKPGSVAVLLTSTICAELRTLRALEISGAIALTQDVLDAIVASCPDLSRLRIPLTSVDSPDILCKLASLTECNLTVFDASGLEFVQSMLGLQRLHVNLQYNIGRTLVLPPGLREFVCRLWDESPNFALRLAGVKRPPLLTLPALQVLDLPAKNLSTCPAFMLEQLQTLVCAVQPADIPFLLDLLPGLARLERLHLSAASAISRRESLRLLSAADFVSPLSALMLERFEVASGSLTWLRVFPGLTELKLLHTTDGDSDSDNDPDLKRVEAFRACPKLRELVDWSASAAVTVGKTEDGRLIKRVGDHVSQLELGRRV